MKSKKIIAVLSALAVVVSSSGGLPFGGLRLFDTAVTASAADTTDYTIDMTAQGFSNAEAVNIVKDSAEIVTVTFDKGSNNGAPKYYTSGDAVRVYGGNTMTVSADSAITSIEFTFGSDEGRNAISANNGTYSEDDRKWTSDGSTKSVTFTVGGRSGNRRIQALKVTVENAAPIPPTKTSLTDYDLKLGTSTLTYTGSEQTVPTTVVKKTGGVPIQEGIDYEVTDNSNKAVNVGNYTVKVKGIGDYDGELTADFEITQADLAGASTNIPESGFENGYIYVYSPWSTTYCYVWGDVSNNAYLGSWPGNEMDKVTDGLFRIEYPELSGSDTAVNFIFNDGLGNQSPDLKYDKSTALGNVWFVAENKSVTFQNKDTVAPAEITLTKDSYVLSGGKADAEITSVTFAGITLVKDTDYEVVGCSDNTAAGTGKITINGKGNYKGTLSKTYSITEPANDPTYTITIPATVNLKSTAPVEITAKDVTLNEGQKIVVTLDGASHTESGSVFSAKDKSGESVVKYKINDGAIGLDDDNKTVAEFVSKEGEQSVPLNFTADASNVKYAGKHTETLTFGVAVEGTAAANPYADKNINDVVEFGDYNWYIIGKSDTGVTLLMKEPLTETKKYNSSYTSVTWETCSLRTYLNGDFYNSFNDADKAMIASTSNTNPDNDSTSGGNDTTDYIYLLSIAEANELDSSVRSCGSWWWLRSPGGNSKKAAVVRPGGYVDTSGKNVVVTTDVVRPALNLEF